MDKSTWNGATTIEIIPASNGGFVITTHHGLHERQQIIAAVGGKDELLAWMKESLCDKSSNPACV